MNDRPSLPVIFRDEHLLVVDKPSGLVVHPGWASDPVDVIRLARAIAGRHVFPVHRLDRGTSGVLVLALDPPTAALVQESFERGEVEKRYVAIVRGTPPAHVVVDHPVRRGESGERVPAVTEVRTLAAWGRHALVEARPRTGRLHQIRRHLKHLAHPVAGDTTYGDGAYNRLVRAELGLHRLALHAIELRLPHPASGEPLCLRAPLPPELVAVLPDQASRALTEVMATPPSVRTATRS